MGYVYPRGRKLSIGFIDRDGKEKQRATPYFVGQEDKAREVLRQVEAAVAARKEYAADDGKLTLERFAARWVEERRGRGIATVADDEARLKKHVLPVLGAMEIDEVRPRHVRELVSALRRGSLAPRTVSNVYGALRAMFSDAVADEVLSSSPVALKRQEVPSRIDKDPRWRATAIFTADELRRVLSSERVPLDRRVAFALMGLAGLRFGEAAAVRWGDLATLEPLSRLWIAESYDTKTKTVKSTKEEQPRGVPVIPELAELLTEWRAHGWRAMLRREPNDADFIIPSRRGANRSVNHMLKKLNQDLERLGMRPRRQHDFRRTFTSLCRAGGAREDLLRFITHGPSPSVMDAYTTLPWQALCDQVHGLHLQLTYSAAKVLELQDEKWRGGRDLNAYAHDEQIVAVAGGSSKSGGTSTVSGGGASATGAQGSAKTSVRRQDVRTVSQDRRALAARILDLPAVQLYVKYKSEPGYREEAIAAILEVLA